MRAARPFVAMVLTGFVVPIAACGNGDDTTVSPVPVPGTDAASDATKDAANGTDVAVGDATLRMDVDAGHDGDGSGPPVEAAPSPVASLRVANWSYDAPPVDFCIAPHGTAQFQGPLLARQALVIDEAGVTDAGPAALPFPGVSSYFFVAPGRYDARLVAAGASDCSTRIVPDATSLPALLVDGAATIALVGETHPLGGDAGDPGLQLVGFSDDTVTAGSVALRFINAAPNLAQADVGTGSGASFKPLFSAIPFGHAGTLAEAQQATAADASPPSIDSNGYDALTSALAAVTFSARARFAMNDAVVATQVSAAAGAILTLAILRPDANAPPDAGSIAQLLECVDNAGTLGLLATCRVISQ